MSSIRKFSKLKNLKYDALELQPYLSDQSTSIKEKISLFKWRTRNKEHFGEKLPWWQHECPMSLLPAT